MSIRLKLDSQSPIPLYHQIAEAIRYRVATGEIPVGAVLPPLPTATVVFHVAPGGQDVADGSEARPFGSLVRARDAIRELKKSRGGSLPKRVQKAVDP